MYFESQDKFCNESVTYAVDVKAWLYPSLTMLKITIHGCRLALVVLFGDTPGVHRQLARWKEREFNDLATKQCQRI